MYKINIFDFDKVIHWHKTKYGRCIEDLLTYICDKQCENIHITVNKKHPYGGKNEDLHIDNPSVFEVFALLHRYGESLLVGGAENLMDIVDKISSKIKSLQLGEKQVKELFNILSQIFRYEAFREGYFMSFDQDKHELFIEEEPKQFYRIYNKEIKINKELTCWGGFEYLQHLGVTVCPYCNAETIFSTIILKGKKKVKIKSALDHYYLRKDQPYLGLSLCNLVPACTRCNTNIKGQSKNWNAKNFPHPYLENFHDGIHFTRPDYPNVPSMQYIDEKDITIALGKDDSNESKKSGLTKKAWNSAKFMNLERIYNALFKKEAVLILNRIRFDIVSRRENYKQFGISDEYMDLFFWGAKLDARQINQNRFAKMIIDYVKGYELKGNKAIPICQK